MAKKKRRKPVKKRPAKPVEAPPKEFLDLIAPAAVRFQTDQMILGDSCRCTLAIRGYPTSTEEMALLRHLGDMSGVLVHAYVRRVSVAEEKKILHNAANKSRMERSNTNDLRQSVTAEANS